MNKIKISILLLGLLLLSSNPGFAESTKFGLSAGPALGFNSDFNNENTKNKLHFAVSASLLYKLQCRSSSFCEGVYLDGSFTWFTPSTYNFGSTQIKNTGLTGNFSEKQTAFGADLSLRKEFLSSQKFHPFVSVGLGFQYFQISNFSFQDSLGNPLQIATKSSSFNMNVTPQVGVRYQLSHKLSVDAGVKAHMTIPGMLKNSFISFPIGIKYSF